MFTFSSAKTFRSPYAEYSLYLPDKFNISIPFVPPASSSALVEGRNVRMRTFHASLSNDFASSINCLSAPPVSSSGINRAMVPNLFRCILLNQEDGFYRPRPRAAISAGQLGGLYRHA